MVFVRIEPCSLFRVYNINVIYFFFFQQSHCNYYFNEYIGANRTIATVSPPLADFETYQEYYRNRIRLGDTNLYDP